MAKAGTEAAQPEMVDPSGSDRDGFVIDYTPGVWFFNDDGTELPAGFHSSGGVATYLLHSNVLDDDNYVIEGPDLTLSFNTAITASEAQDTVRIEVVPGYCDKSFGYQFARVFFTNTDDASDRWVDVNLMLDRRPQGRGTDMNFSDRMIKDGETRELFYAGAEQYPFLVGQYQVVNLLASGTQRRVADTVVPGCGSWIAPHPYPGEATPNELLEARLSIATRPTGNRLRLAVVNRSVNDIPLQVKVKKPGRVPIVLTQVLDRWGGSGPLYAAATREYKSLLKLEHNPRGKTLRPGTKLVLSGVFKSNGKTKLVVMDRLRVSR